MAVTEFPTEKEFLIQLAVRLFNEQYGRAIQPDACSIFSVTPNYTKQYGYEIFTITTADNLRLRIYFDIGPADSFTDYRLEVDTTFIEGSLGDEVYVALGKVNSYYLDSGMYKFRWIDPDPTLFSFFELLDGQRFKFMSGQDFQMVGRAS